MATNQGTVKKVLLSNFRGSRLKTGLIATVLNEGEYLVSVALAKEESTVMLVNDTGMCIRFADSDVRSMGRVSHGVGGMRLPEGSEIVAMIVSNDERRNVLIVTENGYGKRVPISDFRLQRRNGMGLRGIKPSERNGRVVSAIAVEDSDDIMILSTVGKVIRTRASEVPVYSRFAKGVRLLRVEEGEKLVSLRRVERTADEADEDDYERLDLDAAELEAVRHEEAEDPTVEDPVEDEAPADDAEEEVAEDSSKD
mgnify:FL=1